MKQEKKEPSVEGLEYYLNHPDELKDASYLEKLGLRGLLWLEDRLIDLSRPPVFHPKKRGYTKLVVASIVAFALFEIITHEVSIQSSRQLRPQPTPGYQVSFGSEQTNLSSPETVATFSHGLIANFEPRFKVVVKTGILDELFTSSPIFRPKFSTLGLGFTFLTPHTKQQLPEAEKFIQIEDNKRHFTQKYKELQHISDLVMQQTEPYKFLAPIPLNQVIAGAYYSHADQPIQCSYHLVDLGLTLEWTQTMIWGMDKKLTGNTNPPLPEDLAASVDGMRELPFQTLSIDPSLVAESLGVPQTAVKTSGMCG